MVDSTLFSLATLNAHPAMNPDSVIQGDHWRIGLITDALVRFEWSDSGRFVDDATQMAMVRDFGEKPEFTVTERNGWLEIDTPSLHISYNQRKFSPEGLYATVKHVNAIENTWHYGDVQRRNLGGTYRTLDGANGPHPRRSGRQQHRRLGDHRRFQVERHPRNRRSERQPQRFRHVGDPEGRADHRPVPVRLRPPLP